MNVPIITKQWNVVSFEGFSSLRFSEQPVPELGDHEVLVKIQGASLNFRDIIVPQGQYPWDVKPNVVPGSDGAGTVVSVGKGVTRFKPGERVITLLLPQYFGGIPTEYVMKLGLGATVDGTFRSIGVFNEEGLVKMPTALTFIEAATLSCAGLTAWNALFGLTGRPLAPGQWVLTQGTGGVSTFAVQFAKAAGARVIATTSTAEKADLLKKLGADHVINYHDTPEWGQVAKDITGGTGVDMIVDVSGPATLKQSVASVRLDGIIAVVGFVGGESKNEMPTLLDAWSNFFTARGVWVGSRSQMEDMCRALDSNMSNVRPVIDPNLFRLDQVREAYEYMKSGRHLGKICIEISEGGK